MASTSRQHLDCRACAEYQEYVARIESNGVYVADLPPQVTEGDLYSLFRTYGKVADLYLPENNAYCLVHFNDRRSVNDVLCYPVCLYGRELRIRPRFSSKADEDKRAALNEVHSSHEEIFKSFSSENNFLGQVKKFFEAAEAGESDLRRQYAACKDIENALKSISPNYKVMPFGSSVTGLAFKHSDLDIFYGKEAQSNAPDIRDVFRKARTALETLRLINSLKPIPNARVPIIKFVHTSTGLNCDLSFRNTMGVHNSKLIKFLVTLDSRIKPFFMIVKYWAKLHNLTGRRMSNYALVMLMISFLQSLNEPILPPLNKLQHDGVRAIWVGGWNANFDDDPTRLQPVSNNLSLEELLFRFFESVVKTDFHTFVLSPYLGYLIHKRSFSEPNKLPGGLSLYVTNVNAGMERFKTESALCLQDPIELNFNMTKNIAEHDFYCFKDHCHVAYKLSYAIPPHLFLSKFLSTSYNCLKDDQPKSWLPNPMHSRPLRPFMTLYLSYPESVTDTILWTCSMTKKMSQIFRKVLKVSVDDERKGKDTKPGSDQGFICKGSQILWARRDELWKQWFSRGAGVSVSECSTSVDDEVKVLDTTEMQASTSSGSRGEKRKRDEEDGTLSKKRKLEESSNQENRDENSDLEVTVIELEESTTDKPTSRSIQDEINLTNVMVKKGHAMPASSFILDFTCRICRDTDNVRIEISDRRSKNNYFQSLCAFLESFLNKHLADAQDS